MRVNLSDLSAKNRKLKFVTTLLRLFAEDNDITFGNTVKAWLTTPNGAKSLATWASDKGYRVSYWCMEPLRTKNEYSSTSGKIEVTWIGFGLDIDETCPLIIDLKLKN